MMVYAIMGLTALPITFAVSAFLFLNALGSIINDSADSTDFEEDEDA